MYSRANARQIQFHFCHGNGKKYIQLCVKHNLSNIAFGGRKIVKSNFPGDQRTTNRMAASTPAEYLFDVRKTSNPNLEARIVRASGKCTIWQENFTTVLLVIAKAV